VTGLRLRTATVALGLLALGVLVSVALAQGVAEDPAGTTMTHDESHMQPLGSDVMPFDIERSTHIFRHLHDGGTQLIVTDDPSDAEQVRLIRSHLRKERRRFAHGDFGDPTAIHGHDMPGLAELKRGYRRVKITYRRRTGGALLRYRTESRRMVRALHDWFVAQVHAHAPYAELR
jgi:hypothetical protein